jgi:hypothetical protein
MGLQEDSEDWLNVGQAKNRHYYKMKLLFGQRTKLGNDKNSLLSHEIILQFEYSVLV